MKSCVPRLVMIIVYQNQETPEEDLCDSLTQELFLTGGQPELKEFYSSRRLLSLSQTGTLNKEQRKVVEKFFGIVTKELSISKPKEVGILCLKGARVHFTVQKPKR